MHPRFNMNRGVPGAAGDHMKSILRYCAFLTLSLAMVLAAGVQAAGQETEKPNAQKDEHAQDEAIDPLGRSTPHGTVVGFLQAAQSGKYKDAAQYLQLSRRERASEGERLAQQLHTLMDNAFVGRVGAISDRKEGSVQAGVPQDHERIGTFEVNGGKTDVELVRISDPASGEIWLFSSSLLAAVPKLSSQIEG